MDWNAWLSVKTKPWDFARSHKAMKSHPIFWINFCKKQITEVVFNSLSFACRCTPKSKRCSEMPCQDSATLLKAEQKDLPVRKWVENTNPHLARQDRVPDHRDENNISNWQKIIPYEHNQLVERAVTKCPQARGTGRGKHIYRILHVTYKR